MFAKKIVIKINIYVFSCIVKELKKKVNQWKITAHLQNVGGTLIDLLKR